MVSDSSPSFIVSEEALIDLKCHRYLGKRTYVVLKTNNELLVFDIRVALA
jgi:hypothetical protein